MRAMSCRYCFFCSSEPVRASIHFATMSVVPFGAVGGAVGGAGVGAGGTGAVGVRGAEVLDPPGEEGPGGPELVELVPAGGVERVDLARRALLGRDLLDVDETALLDPDQERVHGALGQVREPLVAELRGDLVAVRGPRLEDREDDALERALEHLGHLVGHRGLLYSVSLTTGTT